MSAVSGPMRWRGGDPPEAGAVNGEWDTRACSIMHKHASLSSSRHVTPLLSILSTPFLSSSQILPETRETVPTGTSLPTINRAHLRSPTPPLHLSLCACYFVAGVRLSGILGVRVVERSVGAAGRWWWRRRRRARRRLPSISRPARMMVLRRSLGPRGCPRGSDDGFLLSVAIGLHLLWKKSRLSFAMLIFVGRSLLLSVYFIWGFFFIKKVGLSFIGIERGTASGALFSTSWASAESFWMFKIRSAKGDHCDAIRCFFPRSQFVDDYRRA